MLALGLVTAAGCSRVEKPAGPPFEPRAALSSFDIDDRFRIELVAAEPLIRDPVALEVDEQGRLFVLEMPGYPLDVTGTGALKLLEDIDQDGRPDRSVVFADRFILPTGVMRWKDGFLVLDAPNLLYLEDTDGDDRADIREVVLTGFAATNPQHRANTPIFGLDNWIYIANEPATTAVIFHDLFSDRGGPFRFPARISKASPENDGRSIRVKLDEFRLESLAGRSQFGHAFDTWGRYFTLDNSNHLRHEVLRARYWQRNPDLRAAETSQDMSDHGNAAEIFPVTQNPQYQFLTNVGQITSACSLTLYQGGLFPEPFQRVSFVAEPTHNLVHADLWEDQGASFRARRTAEKSEFLRSTDSWFRPVNFYIGPDDALYVVDYYRRIIEHPEWTAESVAASDSLYDGTNLGRIYRIVPKNAPPPGPWNVTLQKAGEAELVACLERPGIWWRRTAQRLLVERHLVSALPLLQHTARQSRSSVARVHALWTIEGLGKLNSDLILGGLKDSHPGVRENSIRLAEGWLSGHGSEPEADALRKELLNMSSDPDPKVRFQLLCSLGDLDGKEAGESRRRLLFQDIEDGWMQLAALSARSVQPEGLLSEAIKEFGQEESAGRAQFVHRLGALMGLSGNENFLQTQVRRIGAASSWWHGPFLSGLAAGVSERDATQAQPSRRPNWEPFRRLLANLLDNSEREVRRASLQILQVIGPPASLPSRLLDSALATGMDAGQDPDDRADAIRLLVLADPARFQSELKSLVDPGQPDSVQKAAAWGVGQMPGREPARFLLDAWKRMTPQVRLAAGDSLSNDPERLGLLIEAIESDQLPAWTLPFRERRRIIMNRDPAQRRRGRAALDRQAAGRSEVADKFRPALALPASKERGRVVFDRLCSRCHSVGAQLYGPDLATVSNRSREDLFLDILTPSRSIAQNFEVYIIEQKNGSVIEGLIVDESPSTLTVRFEEGRETVLPRSQIASLQASTVSAMPEGLEQEMSVQDLADLIAFLD